MLNEFLKKEAPIQGLAGMGGGVPSRLLTLASGEVTYVDDVFSTFLYEGTGSAKTITNGIDLDGEGGMVWVKCRNSSLFNHQIGDTERGVNNNLSPDTNDANYTHSGKFTAFNSDGFTLGNNGAVNNTSSQTYCSWTFRKCPGFFDIVTYTGNGSYGHDISHNLGSVPGSIWVKRTDTSSNWTVYHRGIDSSAPENYKIYLDEDGDRIDNDWLTDTAPTDTQFRLGSESATNADGGTYVAYLFAHNDGSFGEDSDEAVIKCGGYDGNGTSGHAINVGFEPQLLIIKRATGGDQNWRIFDSMRGIITGGNDNILFPNEPTDEQTSSDLVDLTATGFKLIETNTTVNRSGDRYIYIAIRRPHKPPEAATDVFTPVFATSSGDYTSTAGFPVDFNFYGKRSSSDKWFWRSRLTGNGYIQSNNTNAISGSGNTYWDSMTAFKVPGVSGDYSDYINYNFKRAPGFFDVTTWLGDGVTGRTVNHNLTVAPEFMIVKRLSNTENWYVYHKQPGATKSAFLNGGAFGSSNAWNSTEPTATQIALLGDNAVNGSGERYVGFLWATLDGISKVGHYTGTGSDGNNIDCGLTNGARFVLIKRTDSSADYFVADTVRGINAGSDPFLKINTTDAENNTVDWIDAYSAGFTINGTGGDFNASGGTYIFLAIA